MRTSRYFLATLKEAPADAELVSHKLMVRAGLIRRLAGGIYTWMPLGLRVVRKVEAIVREEMNRAGAIELFMPAVQPAELWQESGRWHKYGPELLRLKDRHERDFCVGPTHEEVVTDIARRDIRSYRQLPVHFYQIQTKFRDEIRPRFGVMRGREFTMKDGYSFHADYAANVELAEAVAPKTPRRAPAQAMKKVPTPGKTRCEDVAELLGLPIDRTVKAIAVMHDGEFSLLLLRGDHALNEIKVQKIAHFDPFRFASDAEIERHLGCKPGYIGPVGIRPEIKVLADRTVATMSDFVCGANEEGFHLTGVNFGRDCPEPAQLADLRKVVAGDASPDGRGTLEIQRGIEVGQIFQLRTQYSEAMKATFLDEGGDSRPFEMGCYGIGITRIVGAAIEQSHDERGIVFPESIAPFQVALVPIGYGKSAAVREAADSIYSALGKAGFEVLLDDRDERPGVMFADIELIGIPHRIVVGERGLKEGVVEYQGRRDKEAKKFPLGDPLAPLRPSSR